MRTSETKTYRVKTDSHGGDEYGRGYTKDEAERLAKELTQAGWVWYAEAE